MSIARDFNWIAFGQIIVMKRADGQMFVVDGQQRLRAAILRGDIRRVPCMVFESDGPEHEARAFVALNVNRKIVSAYHKFHANVMGGVEPEREIAAWLERHNLRVVRNGCVARTIRFPAIFVGTWNANADAARAAILAQVAIDDSKQPVVVVHRGLWWLECSGINTSEHVEKISRHGGQAAMLRAIRALCIGIGGPESFCNCGNGILNVINYKRRKRISISSTNGDGQSE